jgi:hypothetical protein
MVILTTPLLIVLLLLQRDKTCKAYVRSMRKELGQNKHIEAANTIGLPRGLISNLNDYLNYTSNFQSTNFYVPQSEIEV